MDILLEIFLQIFAEFGIQLILELLLDVGAHRVKKHSRRTTEYKIGFSYALYLVLGITLGAVSTVILPKLFLVHNWMAITNIVVSPIIAGLVMALLGRRKRSKGKDVIRLESFANGWTFAFSFALVRYLVITFI
ncbi:MAG: hypothetical protein ACYTFY_05425 [Planctomycetota bacterium]|jgi:H+/Cl- antiporter ClcA